MAIWDTPPRCNYTRAIVSSPRPNTFTIDRASSYTTAALGAGVELLPQPRSRLVLARLDAAASISATGTLGDLESDRLDIGDASRMWRAPGVADESVSKAPLGSQSRGRPCGRVPSEAELA